MNAAELKLKLFRHIDKLDNSMLEEIYGLISNYTKQHINSEQWDSLTLQQQKGIYEAIKQVDNGDYIAHEELVSKYRRKYTDE